MLKVNFNIDATLNGVLAKVGRDQTIGAVFVTIRDETFYQLGETVSTAGALDKDLKTVRDRLTAAQATCAYAIIRVSPTETSVVTYVSDGAKPKDRMLYSAGVGHLVEALKLPKATKAQASAIADIQPQLFRHKESEEGRAALMTEDERLNAAIAKLEVAPQPSRLPGSMLPLSTAADEVLTKFGKNSLPAAIFKLENDSIDLERTVTEDKPLSDLVALLPADHPRFVAALYKPADAPGKKAVMVYVCPAACKPKEKMAYATAKAAFISHADKHNISFDKRVETDLEDFVTSVEEAFQKVNFSQNKPQAPKPVASKGPRMLI